MLQTLYLCALGDQVDGDARTPVRRWYLEQMFPRMCPILIVSEVNLHLRNPTVCTVRATDVVQGA